jgi:hypothetical protein
MKDSGSHRIPLGMETTSSVTARRVTPSHTPVNLTIMSPLRPLCVIVPDLRSAPMVIASGTWMELSFFTWIVPL